MPQPRIEDEDYDLAREVLKSLDVFQTETNVKQMGVLLDAFQIFVERNAKRGDLWRQFGWQDSALQIRSKAMRIALTLDRDMDLDPGEVLDDAHDLINFAAFFIRNVLDPA